MIDPNAPEKDVKEVVKRLCRKYGAYWYMVVPGGFGRRGVPDFLICHKGRFLGLETKKAGVTKPSPFQQNELDAIDAAGGAAMVINARNLHELEEWLCEQP
jgi:hypothetical protein